MFVERIPDKAFNSNTYILSAKELKVKWIIDAGVSASVFKNLYPGYNFKGVLLTHYHFDHILELESLKTGFPECLIYGSSETIEGLADSKKNLSFYHNNPIELDIRNSQLLKDSDEICLFDDIKAIIISTPGHNSGCLSFKVKNYLFTGDSYIPFFNVVTKLKGGDKKENKESLLKIRNSIDENTIICPGHGPEYYANQIIGHLDSLL